MRRIKKLPSPSMAVAFVALFVAGAGGATAATGLLDSGDIKNNTLSSKDVKDRSLLRKDFKRGQLPAGARGSQGPQGIAGPAGRAGRDGFGVLSYPSEGVSLPDGSDPGFLDADCPAGQYPTGGDALAFDDNDDLHPELIEGQVYHLDGDGRPQGWRVFVAANGTGDDVVVIVDAICANASPPDPQAVSKAKSATALGARPLR